MPKLAGRDASQLYLLPPDIRDWAPEDDLAHFVLEAVERVPMSAFQADGRGTGSAQCHPRMMLALPACRHANGHPARAGPGGRPAGTWASAVWRRALDADATDDRARGPCEPVALLSSPLRLCGAVRRRAPHGAAEGIQPGRVRPAACRRVRRAARRMPAFGGKTQAVRGRFFSRQAVHTRERQALPEVVASVQRVRAAALGCLPAAGAGSMLEGPDGTPDAARSWTGNARHALNRTPFAGQLGLDIQYS